MEKCALSSEERSIDHPIKTMVNVKDVNIAWVAYNEIDSILPCSLNAKISLASPGGRQWLLELMLER